MLLSPDERRTVRPFFIQSAMGDVHSDAVLSIQAENNGDSRTTLTFAVTKSSYHNNHRMLSTTVAVPYPVVKELFRRHGYEFYGAEELQEMTDAYKAAQPETHPLLRR